jgi:serine phosphatase RsbU (regulator of sigma subunit)
VKGNGTVGYRFDIAIRTTHKYAVSTSGDIARVVELPDGGVALVVVDGQGSGPSARALARDAAARMTTLLESGSAAETAALAANQAATALRNGQISISIDIVRFLADGNVDVARYSTNDVVVSGGTAWERLSSKIAPAGRSANTRPDLVTIPGAETNRVVVATDGFAASGTDLRNALDAMTELGSVAEIADQLFERAMAAMQHRPKDDLTIAVAASYRIEADQRIERLEYSREAR